MLSHFAEASPVVSWMGRAHPLINSRFTDKIINESSNIQSLIFYCLNNWRKTWLDSKFLAYNFYFLEIAILLLWLACCSSKICQSNLSFKFKSLLKYVWVDHSRSVFPGMGGGGAGGQESFKKLIKLFQLLESSPGL